MTYRLQNWEVARLYVGLPIVDEMGIKEGQSSMIGLNTIMLVYQQFCNEMMQQKRNLTDIQFIFCLVYW